MGLQVNRPIQRITNPSIRTTSKALLGTVLSAPSASSSQRSSGAPLTYHPLPSPARSGRPLARGRTLGR